VLYPNKTGKVHDLLEEAGKQIDVSETGKLRYSGDFLSHDIACFQCNITNLKNFLLDM